MATSPAPSVNPNVDKGLNNNPGINDPGDMTVGGQDPLPTNDVPLDYYKTPDNQLIHFQQNWDTKTGQNTNDPIAQKNGWQKVYPVQKTLPDGSIDYKIAPESIIHAVIAKGYKTDEMKNLEVQQKQQQQELNNENEENYRNKVPQALDPLAAAAGEAGSTFGAPITAAEALKDTLTNGRTSGPTTANQPSLLDRFKQNYQAYQQPMEMSEKRSPISSLIGEALPMTATPVASEGQLAGGLGALGSKIPLLASRLGLSEESLTALAQKNPTIAKLISGGLQGSVAGGAIPSIQGKDPGTVLGGAIGGGALGTALPIAGKLASHLVPNTMSTAFNIGKNTGVNPLSSEGIEQSSQGLANGRKDLRTNLRQANKEIANKIDDTVGNIKDIDTSPVQQNLNNLAQFLEDSSKQYGINLPDNSAPISTEGLPITPNAPGKSLLSGAIEDLRNKATALKSNDPNVLNTIKKDLQSKYNPKMNSNNSTGLQMALNNAYSDNANLARDLLNNASPEIKNLNNSYGTIKSVLNPNKNMEQTGMPTINQLVNQGRSNLVGELPNPKDIETINNFKNNMGKITNDNNLDTSRVYQLNQLLNNVKGLQPQAALATLPPTSKIPADLAGKTGGLLGRSPTLTDALTQLYKTRGSTGSVVLDNTISNLLNLNHNPVDMTYPTNMKTIDPRYLVPASNTQ